MSIQTKIVISLITLAVIDMVIPVPILGLILIYVVFQKPAWFADIVGEIYKV